MASSEQVALVQTTAACFYAMSPDEIAPIVNMVAAHTKWPSLRRRLLLSMNDAGIAAENIDEQNAFVAERREKRNKQKDQENERFSGGV